MISTEQPPQRETPRINETVSIDAASWQANWQLALVAAALLAVDPRTLCGAVLRARPGLVRDEWLRHFVSLMPADVVVKRVPGNISDARLLGGLDLTSTLAAGRPVAERGIMAECHNGVAVFPMAERMTAAMAAKVANIIDTGEVMVERDGFQLRHGTTFVTLLFDEAIEDDESASPALADRLAFHLDLGDFPERLLHRPSGLPTNKDETLITAADVAAARGVLAKIVVGDTIVEALTATAHALGIESMRAPIFALYAARAIAAINGHLEVLADDVQAAAQLVLAPRARRLPASPPNEQTPDEPCDETSPSAESAESSAESTQDQQANVNDRPLEDVVLAATAAAIPDKLLRQLIAQGAVSGHRQPSAGGAGQLHHSSKRGRVIDAIRGDIRAGARINVLATLRAAAPWQRIRKADLANSDARGNYRLVIRREDFRVNRFQERAETTTIFVVDASGSAALHRLAEAKGAVELLLADCYIRRDRVAVLAFRGKSAEVLLPPTRSLVRAKRSLATLPGGGGTPLAGGLDAAREMAEGISRRSGSVMVVVLTDGRANIARNGVGDRAAAEADALSAARSFRLSGARSLLVDTSPSASPRAAALADAMGATYLPLPHAGAKTLHAAVKSATAVNTRTSNATTR